MRLINFCAFCRKERKDDEYCVLISNKDKTECITQRMEGKSRLIYHEPPKVVEFKKEPRKKKNLFSFWR